MPGMLTVKERVALFHDAANSGHRDVQISPTQDQQRLDTSCDSR